MTDLDDRIDVSYEACELDAAMREELAARLRGVIETIGTRDLDALAFGLASGAIGYFLLLPNSDEGLRAVIEAFLEKWLGEERTA